MDKFYLLDDDSVIYKGDMRDIVKDLKFDYIITDPPYNIGYNYVDYKDKMSSEDYIEMLSILKPYKSVVIHYPEEFMGDVGKAFNKPERCVSWCYNSNQPRQHRMLCWFNCSPDFKKVGQPYKNPKDKRVKKLIEQGREARLYDWWDDIQIIKNVSKEECKDFTNQIPIELLERIIKLTTKEGDTILDPFFGSGSLYFACKNIGRKCIGIEQSQKHIDCFFQRLSTYSYNA